MKSYSYLLVNLIMITYYYIMKTKSQYPGVQWEVEIDPSGFKVVHLKSDTIIDHVFTFGHLSICISIINRKNRFFSL